jgi:hypothetical protein
MYTSDENHSPRRTENHARGTERTVCVCSGKCHAAYCPSFRSQLITSTNVSKIKWPLIKEVQSPIPHSSFPTLLAGVPYPPINHT